MSDYQKELEFAKDLATKAGNIMVKYFRSHLQQQTIKADHTPLTIADSKINKMVIDEVKKSFPSHGILGEEGSYKSDRLLSWVCDPIDGTFSFTQGVPISVFSLALYNNGVPVVAVVYNPFLNTMYSAKKGEGAFLNDEQLATLPAQNPISSLHSIGIEIWVDQSTSVLSQFESFGRFFAEVEKREIWFNVFNSAVYTAMLVAEGKASAVIYSGIAPWDAAACQLILAEVGASTQSIFGDNQLYNQNIKGFIGTAPYFAGKLESIITSSGLRGNN